MEHRSQWMDDEWVEKFLKGPRKAIPTAELQLTVLTHIVNQWLPTPGRVLDLGCGDGLLGRMILDRFPDAQVTFIDFSDAMLEAAGKAVEGNSRALCVKADLALPDWMDVVRKQLPCDLVVSGLAIHHIGDVRKIALYREIFHLLADGGVFLNLEHVSSPTPAVEHLHDELYIDHLHSFYKGEKDRETLADEYRNRPDRKENLLSPVQIQCEWLREAGFRDVDCYYKLFELAIFGGRKP